MRIMAYNTQHCLNYIHNKIDFQAVANVIKKYDADIVGLNEMRDKGVRDDYENQTSVLSELSGLENSYFGKAIMIQGENPYGNAFLSKYKILSAETIPVPDPEPRTGNSYYETRCLVKVKLEGGITVLVIHFGLNSDEQKNAVDTVMRHIEKEKCILMGDFNVTPEDKVLDPIRACMTDTADYFEKPLMSYPSEAPDRKIDYIFVSKDVEVVSADIPAIMESDHRPYVAEINI